MRDAVLTALVGGRPDGAIGAAEADGLRMPTRIALTLIAFGISTLVWEAARAGHLIGSASLYFPAILVVTLFTGWEFGLVMLAASAALIWTVIGPDRPGGTLVFVAAGLLEVLIAGLVREVLRSSRREERRLHSLAEKRQREADSREMALGEARHRLKNLLAIIEALAKFSAPRPRVDLGVDAFMQRFLGRLRALGTASDLVLKFRPDVLEAGALLTAVLQPFLADVPPRLRIDGPRVDLSEEFGGQLALAVHELATNALKYGALSTPAGTVSLTWTKTPAEHGEQIAFEWRESGGPPPTSPLKDGFGHRLIRSLATRGNEGQVLIEYHPDGLFCRIAYLRRNPPNAPSPPAAEPPPAMVRHARPENETNSHPGPARDKPPV